MGNHELLYGSASLTREENLLRLELAEWVKAKLRKGHRPVPLYVALQIIANWTKDPDAFGLRSPRLQRLNPTRWRRGLGKESL